MPAENVRRRSTVCSAKLNGIDPDAYMAEVLRRIAEHDQSDRRTSAMESVPGPAAEVSAT
jgi:hypothetical protein